jgi:ribosomal protein S18 acetylase RimI-like enzyme
MKSKILIRKFHLSNYDAILNFWDETGLHYRPKGRDSRERIEKEIKKRHNIFLIAEADGKIVGTILGTHDGRKGWLNRVAIAKKFRRQGIARRLVTELEHRLDKLGLDVIACLIEGDNKTSMKFFNRLGYEKSDVLYFSKRKTLES